jgi:hypothetical protein
MDIRKMIQAIKKSKGTSCPYIICIDDKIVFASSPITKLLKIDPVGMSITSFLSEDDREEVLENIQKTVSGLSTRKVRLGTQAMRAVFDTTRERLDGKTISTIVLKDAALMDQSEFQTVRPLKVN